MILMNSLIARADGTVSRTKATNALAVVSALIVAVPAVQGLVPAWIYSVLLAGFAVAQQFIRDSQTKI